MKSNAFESVPSHYQFYMAFSSFLTSVFDFLRSWLFNKMSFEEFTCSICLDTVKDAVGQVSFVFQIFK